MSATGIAVFVGSVLAVAPVAVAALAEAPSASVSRTPPSASAKRSAVRVRLQAAAGSRVAVQELPTVRIDAKDHPNYGQITPEYRGDVKDHPNYGQITPEYRGDVKDHPNYGQVTTPTGTSAAAAADCDASRSEPRARDGGDDGEQGQIPNSTSVRWRRCSSPPATARLVASTG